jgi:hypothetical protein
MYAALRRTMQKAVGESLVAVAILAATLILMPTLMVILVWLIYPFVVLLAFWIIGWRMGKRSQGDFSESMSRWRSALIVGTGTGVVLTLALLCLAILIGLAFSSWIFWLDPFGENAERGETFPGLFAFTLKITGYYIAGAFSIGIPCAVFSAWLALRNQRMTSPTTQATAR